MTSGGNRERAKKSGVSRENREGWQFCGGKQPLMKVYQTHLYKQEVMYAVLVDSPDNEFLKCPPLPPDDPTSATKAVCCYKDLHTYIWRPEAMCETHRYELVQNPETGQMEAKTMNTAEMKDRGYRPYEFYVWDNVGIALHVEDGKLLEFSPDRLREKLKFCEGGPGGCKSDEFDDFKKAEETVRKLWPEDPSPLQREEDPSPLDRDEEQDINEAE